MKSQKFVAESDMHLPANVVDAVVHEQHIAAPLMEAAEMKLPDHRFRPARGRPVPGRDYLNGGLNTQHL